MCYKLVEELWKTTMFSSRTMFAAWTLLSSKGSSFWERTRLQNKTGEYSWKRSWTGWLAIWIGRSEELCLFVDIFMVKITFKIQNSRVDDWYLFMLYTNDCCCETVSTSPRTLNLWYKHLGMEKLTPRWLLRFLTRDKEQRFDDDSKRVNSLL